MDLKTCKKCGRMFSGKEEQEYCNKCRLDIEDHFKIVREYVYDHPNATVNEVSDDTGVEKEEVLKYLRDGKLELKEESAVLSCMRCGKPIKSGRMCSECSKELKQGFNEAFDKDKSKNNKKDKKKKSNKGWHTKRK